MTDLWLKFPDDAVFTAIPSTEGKQALERVFAVDDAASPWRAALALMKLPPVKNTRMIKWYKDAPYFNGAAMAAAVSGGAVVPQRTADGGYAFTTRIDRRSLFGLLRNQWRITKFRQRADSLPDSIALSLALGLVIQSHILRLGSHAPKLAAYLAAPETAPPSVRMMIADIQALQMRRTIMSGVWRYVLPEGTDEGIEALPEFFWDDDGPVSAKKGVMQDTGPWKGIAVCGGIVTGLVVPMERGVTIEALRALKAQYNAPLILLFRAARPQAVEYFSIADGLLFCEGGALSHACTVAREMNRPCITALGPGLWAYAATVQEKVWLALDGYAGTVAPVTVPVPA